MPETFVIHSIGVVRKQGSRFRLEIDARYRDAFLGLDGFSHIWVYYWFNRNDTPGKREVLQVRPRKDANLPLTGVFATHSPLRPNLIAMSCCRIVSIKGTTITIDNIDAFDGSPVIDIKCYIPPKQPVEGLCIPEWV